MKFDDRLLEKVFLISILVLGIILSFFALNTEMLGEDEASYYSYAKEFSQGNFQFRNSFGWPIVLYVFMPLVQSSFFILFGASMGIAKLVSALFGILTIFVVYLIGRRVSIRCGIISASLVLIVTSFSHYMLLSYTETGIAFFSALIAYFLIKFKNKKDAILLGIILGFSYHMKIIGLFLIIAAIIYLLFQKIYYKKDKNYLKLILISIAVCGIVIFPVVFKNMVQYGYPYFQPLNPFFNNPHEVFSGSLEQVEIVSQDMLSLNYYLSSLGLFLFLLSIFGIVYVFQEYKKCRKIAEPLLIMTITFLLFLLLSSKFLGAVIESRYMISILPQLALISGIFLNRITKIKYTYIIILILIIFSFYTLINVGYGTSLQQRYTDEYKDALSWLRDNTPEDSIIFALYSGSIKYYGERDTKWFGNIQNFEEMMTNPEPEMIYNSLKDVNISYIVIWTRALAPEVFIPESNIHGAMTYRFVDVVLKNSKYFETIFSNTETIILKIA